MDLVELLLALQPLLEDPAANWAEISRLMQENNELAEYEVARHLVFKAVGGAEARSLLRSVDPAERLRGVELVRHIFPRAYAGSALRHVVKDPDSRVRSKAVMTIRRLDLDEIGLPDTNFNPQPDDVLARGNWNWTGWLFGTAIYRPSRTDALARNGLPELKRPAEVAALFGMKAKELVRLLRPGTESGAPYVEFTIPKASGGTRTISAPRAPLKKAQRILLDRILSRLEVHDACHGFVPGRSVVTNARPHQKAAIVIKMDLHDFFPSIHYRRVLGLFRSLGYGENVAGLLAGLTTHRPKLPDGRVVWPGALPQGAPTSPAIANAVARRLDTRLAGLCQRVGAAYTRYADDLTFSFATPPEIPIGRFCWWVSSICQQEGFVENAGKRRILRPGNQQRVTGVVVNSGLFVPRKARRRFRAILHNCRKNGVAAEARGRDDFADYLRGFAAYVHMVQPELGRKLIAEVDEVLAGAPS